MTDNYLYTEEAFDKALLENDAVTVYFNTVSCNVGESLAPKVKTLIADKFPKMKFFHVDMGMNPEIAAKYSVFVEPTILIFFIAKETVRKSRHFSTNELESAIARPYGLLYE